MIEIFVSSLCPDCTEIIKNYKENPEDFENAEVIDITKSMANLKRFLSYRDHKDEFKEKIETGQVGIPVKIIDGKDIIFI